MRKTLKNLKKKIFSKWSKSYKKRIIQRTHFIINKKNPYTKNALYNNYAKQVIHKTSYTKKKNSLYKKQFIPQNMLYKHLMKKII